MPLNEAQICKQIIEPPLATAGWQFDGQVRLGPGRVRITGTIGRTCVVPDDIGSAITSKHVYRIRFPKKRVNPHYVSYLINFDSKTREQLDRTHAALQETRSLHSASDLTHLRTAILREAFSGRL